MTGQWALALTLWLVGVNAATILAFGQDKRLAREGRRRIPERMLLWMAFLGGSPGALAARQVYRHKTRKQPFSAMLYAVCVLQLGLIAWVSVAGWDGLLGSSVAHWR